MPTNEATNNNSSDTSPRQFDDNMRGVLYKNEQRTSDKHPHARGRAMIDGVWYWVSAWTQHSRTNRSRYQSLAYTKMTDEEVDKYINSKGQGQQQTQQQTQQQPQGQPQSTPAEFNADGSQRVSNTPAQSFDSDIPF